MISLRYMNNDILKILEIPEETQTIEFKRLSGDRLVVKVIQTIVAMTNTDGGIIFLGVDDPEKTKLKGLSRIYGIEENPDLFDVVVISAEVGCQKPQPEIFDILFKKLDLKPSEVIFIDDTLKSLEGADKIGYIPVLYKDNKTLKSELSSILVFEI